jgi:ATP-dependent phosphoenolpyruvate carboxykinase
LLRRFAGWDPKYRIKVRVICSRPYHALFMHTMLIRLTKDVDVMENGVNETAMATITN